MSAAMTTMLEQACANEPPVGNAVNDIFRRAEHLHRKRVTTVLVAALCAVAVLILLGYALTTYLLPTTAKPHPPTAAIAAVTQPRPTADLDPALSLLSRPIDAKNLSITPEAAGPGWRAYAVKGPQNNHIRLAIYNAPTAVCLPVKADPLACATPDTTPTGMQYARYATEHSHEVIARRVVDGRTLALQVTSLTGTPLLTLRELATLATNPRLLDAFGLGESCNPPTPPPTPCPTFPAPVRPI
jgi:hypothetical protein